jgi:hypothetical protein
MRPRRLFGTATPGQMHLKNATVLRSEKRIIGRVGMAKGNQFQAR